MTYFSFNKIMLYLLYLKKKVEFQTKLVRVWVSCTINNLDNVLKTC